MQVQNGRVAIQDLIQAISNPHRRRILHLVWDDELPAREIAAQFDVTWSAVSQNLRLLNRAGLVRERRVGTQRFYRADPDAFGELRQYLESYWADRLSRLKDEAELEARRSRRGGR